MTEVAADDPDAYVDILQNLNNFAQSVVSTYGRDAALSYGDVKLSKPIQQYNAQLRMLVDRILDDDTLTEEQQEEKIKALGYKYSQKVQEVVFGDNDKRHTALASQINSGSRGSKTQLMQLQFGNMMMKDALNRDIPYLMLDPYISGTSPMGYWVSASSGRKGFYDTQAATGQAGYLGKQVTAATHGTVIETNDCGTTDTGVPFKANSDKNIGAVLLRPFHNHPAGSIVTAKMVAEADDDEEMILRSPTTCKCKYGVCAKCNGLGENGKFPEIGEYVPLNAARSFVEVITQQGIKCLHPKTPVRMADWSIKALEDIEVGDMVMGADTNGEMRPARVVNTFNHGLMPMYVTTYRHGFKTKRRASLVSTLNHKALLLTIKSNCKDEANNNVPRILPVGIKARNCSAFPAQAPYTYSGEYVREALFLGLMTGDGCYTKGVLFRPHFSCADPSLITDTETYMRSLGLRFVFHKGSQCYYRVASSEPEVNIKGKQTGKGWARKYLEKYDMLGSYAYEKEFPKGYEHWDTESISEFISGLIITDGCLFIHPQTGKPMFNYGSTSLKLCLQLREMLYKHFGVLPTRITKNVSGTTRKKPLYQVFYTKTSEVLKIYRNVKLYGVKEPRRQQHIEILERCLADARQPEKQVSFKRMAQKYCGDFEALDIEVDNESHLFVLANGLIVSNSKHAGGVGGRKVVDPEGEDQPTGFRNLERLFMAPKNFPGGAVLAPADGIVSKVQKAPQGGTYITVGSNTLYCIPERTIKVKPGDKVYAGDVLTNGVPNPLEVMDLKGLGSGRRYFMTKLNDILKEQGWATDRRNVEAFTRSMISKVRITDPDGYKQYLPGEIADYNEIMADYQPREGSVTTTADKAINKYLEKPALFYSIGTRVTPEVAADLKKYKFENVTVNDKEPPFKAQFLRPAVVLQNDKNWLPRLAGERLQAGLFDAAQKGITDSYDSTSYVDKIVAKPFQP